MSLSTENSASPMMTARVDKYGESIVVPVLILVITVGKVIHGLN
jgi:hypothetical protein